MNSLLVNYLIIPCLAKNMKQTGTTLNKQRIIELKKRNMLKKDLQN